MAWSKESRQSRGYGAQWDKLRKVILQRDSYLCQCEDCKRGKKVLPANEVHHIKGKADGGTDDPANLISINHDCHVRETQRAKGYRPPAGADLKGWPTDPRHPWNVAPRG